jgi:lipoprotein-releasing system ATP-binding protein
VLTVDNVTKSYATPRGTLPILNGISLTLDRGDAIAIMGPSGSGKSTLLYILGVLDAPTSGTVRLDDRDPFTLGESEQAAFRNQRIGFVFQDHSLLPQCSVLENVLAPTLVAPAAEFSVAPETTERPKRGDATARARELLVQVGLGDRLDHRPGELSGGEKQRAAVARALIRQPQLVLCDEPTGNLDKSSAESVASLLLDLHARLKTILIVVTHSGALAERFPVRYEMNGGRLEEMKT